jgi:hypothetical protein
MENKELNKELKKEFLITKSLLKTNNFNLYLEYKNKIFLYKKHCYNYLIDRPNLLKTIILQEKNLESINLKQKLIISSEKKKVNLDLIFTKVKTVKKIGWPEYAMVKTTRGYQDFIRYRMPVRGKIPPAYFKDYGLFIQYYRTVHAVGVYKEVDSFKKIPIITFPDQKIAEYLFFNRLNLLFYINIKRQDASGLIERMDAFFAKFSIYTLIDKIDDMDLPRQIKILTTRDSLIFKVNEIKSRDYKLNKLNILIEKHYLSILQELLAKKVNYREIGDRNKTKILGNKNISFNRFYSRFELNNTVDGHILVNKANKLSLKKKDVYEKTVFDNYLKNSFINNALYQNQTKNEFFFLQLTEFENIVKVISVLLFFCMIVLIKIIIAEIRNRMKPQKINKLQKLKKIKK